MLSKARLFFYVNLLFLFCIIFRNVFFLNSETDFLDEFINWHHQKVEFRGYVCEEARLDYKTRRLTVCSQGRVLITTTLYPEYNYGDFLLVTGKLVPPPQFDTFDYARYLRRQNVYSVMYYPQILEVEGQLYWQQQIYLKILQIKWKIKRTIEKSLPDPESNLALAMVLGYKSLLHPDDAQIFSRAGLSHLIAISGAHIAIIIALLLNFLQNLGWGRKNSLKIVLIFLIIYPIITGLSASAVRASLMGALMLIALYHNRLSSSLNTLFFSASLMLFFNPLLLSDVGFQLSFSAVLGIIYFQPINNYLKNKISNHLKNWPTRIFISFWEIFSLTTICQLAILPIMLINFKQVSLVAWIANPLLIWFFPFLLTTLLLPLIPALLFPGLSFYLFLPAYFILKILIFGANYFASLSWAVAAINNFSYLEVFLYYFFLIFVIWRLNKYVKYQQIMDKLKTPL